MKKFAGAIIRMRGVKPILGVEDFDKWMKEAADIDAASVVDLVDGLGSMNSGLPRRL